MASKAGFLATAATALLLGAAFSTAQALDVSVGGVSVSAGSGGDSGGGLSVSVGAGDASVGATVGGGSSIADTNVGVGDTSVGATIANTSGDLIETQSNDGHTQANVNLGGFGLGSGVNNIVNGVTDPAGDLLDDVDLGSLPGLPGGGGGGAGGGGGGIGGGGGGGSAVAAFNGLAPRDQQLLRARCSTVLARPASFAAGVVTLCRVIARL